MKELNYESEIKVAKKETFLEKLKNFFTFKSLREFNWKQWARRNLTWKGVGKFLWTVARTVLLFGLCFLILYPFVVKLIISFMSLDDLTDSTVMFIPRNTSTYFIQKAVYTMSYWKSLGNTALLSVTVAVLQLMIAAFVGYGFARFKFKGRNILFFLVILSLIVPAQTTIIPLYFTFSNMKLIDTLWPVIIITACGIGLKNGMYIYLMRQNFRGLPKSLEESAYIDGAGPLRTFFRVALPNASNMLITIFLFSFTWQWTDTTYNKMLMPKIKMLATVLPNVTSTVQNDPEQAAALLDTAGLLVVLPLLIVFLFGQRYFVQSIERSGLVE